MKAVILTWRDFQGSEREHIVGVHRDLLEYKRLIEGNSTQQILETTLRCMATFYKPMGTAHKDFPKDQAKELIADYRAYKEDLMSKVEKERNSLPVYYNDGTVQIDGERVKEQTEEFYFQAREMEFIQRKTDFALQASNEIQEFATELSVASVGKANELRERYKSMDGVDEDLIDQIVDKHIEAIVNGNLGLAASARSGFHSQIKRTYRPPRKDPPPKKRLFGLLDG